MPTKSTTRSARPGPSAPRRHYLSPGQHIAPFLSPRGALVMLVIGRDRSLVSSYDVDGPDLSQKDDRQVDDSSPLLVWDDGIHVAPWRATKDFDINPAGTVLLGISECRLLCEMTVNDPADLAAARADLAVQLEVIATSDPASRLHDEDDEADDDGEDDEDD
jgi:hypothetical protein